MVTIGIKECKAKLSEILRNLGDHDEVIITHRGQPCGKIVSILPSREEKPSLETLRGTLTELPDANYQDFLEIKTVWETALPNSEETALNRNE